MIFDVCNFILTIVVAVCLARCAKWRNRASHCEQAREAGIAKTVARARRPIATEWTLAVLTGVVGDAFAGAAGTRGALGKRAVSEIINLEDFFVRSRDWGGVCNGDALRSEDEELSDTHFVFYMSSVRISQSR
jgi:hypothetical protein